jgi:uncharacterized protein (TIGR02757 family)
VLTEKQARELKPDLNRFVDSRKWNERIAKDPIEFPHRYQNPQDIEVVGFIACALAYGRVELFKPKIEFILSQLGPNPARAILGLNLKTVQKMCHGFVYRFNVASDIAALLLGMRETLKKHGTLENAFVNTRVAGDTLVSITNFSKALVSRIPLAEIKKLMGPTRGLNHLIPLGQGGVSKRMNLYLRWMIRGPDEIDFGIWKQVSPAELLIPLDTHIARVAHWLKLTSRIDASPKTVHEITASLRLLDAKDPIRYDFALCHYGMSGACPLIPVKTNCTQCALLKHCKMGTRTAR